MRAWGVPVSQRDVATRYGDTHVLCCGSENCPPLLLLHDVLQDSAVLWRACAAGLSRAHRIYAVDTLGGPGRSRPNETYFHAFDQILWLDDVLDGLRLDKASVMGFAYGGCMAQQYCAVRPRRVHRLALVSSPLCADDAVSASSPLDRATRAATFLPTRARMERSITRSLGGVRNKPDFASSILHGAAILRGYQIAAMMPHRMRDLGDEQIDLLRVRALFIIGGQDRMLDPREVKASLDRHRMNYRYDELAGHMPQAEHPEAFVSMTAGFLS